MNYHRVLTVQDISCFGQCSTTVALPILSACGLETVILPTAVLSNHTAPGFSGWTFRDLSADIPEIEKRWKKENVTFHTVYTGYLGTKQIISDVAHLIDAFEFEHVVIDPAMGDNGKLYAGFDAAYADAMKTLCARADWLLPNITEACYLTGCAYREEYDLSYIESLCRKLTESGAKNVLLTGVRFSEKETGFALLEGGKMSYFRHELLPNSCHGTGDVWASAFTGALVAGKSAFDAGVLACDFVVRCLRSTAKEKDHWYGTTFEKELPYLCSRFADGN